MGDLRLLTSSEQDLGAQHAMLRASVCVGSPQDLG